MTHSGLFKKLVKQRAFGALAILFSAFVLPAISTPSSVMAKTVKLTTDQKAAKKTIKVLINSIRYGKDDNAAKKIDFDGMTKRVMGDSWEQATDAQKKELIEGLGKLVTTISFEKGRGMFKHIDTIAYEPALVDGENATCRSTIVVHRKYKKTEIIIDWVLKKTDKWRIVDTIMLGEITSEGVHEDEVEPLLDEGGIPKVLEALRKKLKA